MFSLETTDSFWEKKIVISTTMHTSDQRAMDAVNTSNQLAVSASTYCYDFETLEIGPGRLPITLVALKFIEKLAFSDKFMNH